jgi:hypothetical protein
VNAKSVRCEAALFNRSFSVSTLAKPPFSTAQLAPPSSET